MVIVTDLAVPQQGLNRYWPILLDQITGAASVKKTLAGVIEAGEPLIRQAIDAQRRYQTAQDAGEPAAEIELLRLEAESLYQAVTEYQLRSLGGPARTLH